MRRMRGRVCGLLAVAVCAGTVVLAQRPEGGPPGGERRGPPSPEQFVERALTFDADGDGKLDRSELMKLAEEMQARRPQGGPDGPRGGGPRRGPGGDGGFGGEGRRGPPQGGEGGRPERPRRPE